MSPDDAPKHDAAPAPRETGLDGSLLYPRVPGATREEVLEEICSRLARAGYVRDPGELVRCLLDRERLGCTGLGHGIAIPHCKLRDVDRVVVAVATTESPIEFGAADGAAVDLIFLVISPVDGAAAHLQTLARVSRLLRAPEVVESLRRAPTPEALGEVLREAPAVWPVSR